MSKFSTHNSGLTVIQHNPMVNKDQVLQAWKGLEKEQSYVLITCKPALMSKYVKTKLEVLFHLGIMWESLLTSACLLYF